MSGVGSTEVALQAELGRLQNELDRLRHELAAERRLRRLITESHRAADVGGGLSHLHGASADPLRERIRELEAELRLVQLSRPYRIGQFVRQAARRLRRSRPTRSFEAPLLPPMHILRPGVGRPIVFFVPWLTQGGGGDQFVRDLAAAAVADGRTAGIVVTHGHPPEMSKETDVTEATRAITPHVFDLSSIQRNDDRLALCESLVAELDRPVIVNVGSTWLYRNLRAIRAAAGQGATIVDQLFNHVGHVWSDVAAGSDVDLTIVAHEGLRRLLVEHYGVKRPVVVIHVGLRPLSEPLRREGERELPVVAWLGRLSPEKRPLWFVELARALDGRARFLLGGTGPEGHHVERAARGIRTLEIAGFVRDGVAFLDQADVVVVTSEVEGISVVAMEAIARGIPVVTTDVGGMADLIRSGANGQLVSPDDHHALVDAVARLLDAPDELAVLRERVREERLPDEFTIETMARRFRELVG